MTVISIDSDDKRFVAAVAAMQSLISVYKIMQVAMLANAAVEQADALLKALDARKGNE